MPKGLGPSASMDVVILIRLCAVAVLLSAAVGKSVRFNLFMSTLMMLGSPRRLLRILGVGVILMETMIALTLLSGHLLLAGLGLMGFAVVFAASAIVAIRKQLHVPCACFGSASQPLGPRNIVIAGMLLLASFPLLASHGSAPLHRLIHGGSLWGYAALAAAMLLAVRWMLAARSVVRLVQDRHAAQFHADTWTSRARAGD
jgi:hypothetical protein